MRPSLAVALCQPYRPPAKTDRCCGPVPVTDFAHLLWQREWGKRPDSGRRCPDRGGCATDPVPGRSCSAPGAGRKPGPPRRSNHCGLRHRRPAPRNRCRWRGQRVRCRCRFCRCRSYPAPESRCPRWRRPYFPAGHRCSDRTGTSG